MSKEKNRLVVAPGTWYKDAPDWLLDEIRAERLVRGLARIGGMFNDDSENEKVGLAETCLYLYSYCLYAPPTETWVEIYMYVMGKVCEKSSALQRDLPDFIQEKLDEGLTEYEERKLDDLRRDIYRKRGEVSHPLLDATREVFGEFTEKEESSREQTTISKWTKKFLGGEKDAG